MNHFNGVSINATIIFRIVQCKKDVRNEEKIASHFGEFELIYRDNHDIVGNQRITHAHLHTFTLLLLVSSLNSMLPPDFVSMPEANKF